MPSPSFPDVTNSAFHRGELYAQQQAGMLEKMAGIGPRVIRDYMPEQHRQFFEQLPFLVVGSRDAQGQPWASLLVGEPGFMRSPDEHTLTVRHRVLHGDLLGDNLHEGMKIGLLGIEPHTRRRNRANGVVAALGDDALNIHIEQSFGNCPKYIQAREPVLIDSAGLPPSAIDTATVLTPAMQSLIRNADTFFIATSLADDDSEGGSNQRHGVDVSHRGGKPGFVKIDGDSTLTVPDFIGNSFFNTIGNLLVQPRAGLLFVDFARGDMLYLAVTAEVIWRGPEVEAFTGAERLLRFQVHQAKLVTDALPLRWSDAQPSPFLDRMGSWQ